MKLLCKSLGGSRAYGLETPTSDVDYRGVFINTDPAEILGLKRFEVIQKQETEDEVYYEVRKFFELLRQGNTGALEILFANDSGFLEMSEDFRYLRLRRSSFVDTDKMFGCLRGYMQSERRLANGDRTGQLGGKRKAQLEKYGFSPKNFVQLFRLAWAGMELFKTGEFPVRVRDFDPVFADWLLDLKTHPEKFTKEQLNELVDAREAEFVVAFENRQVVLKFNEELANDLLKRFYLPYLTR